MPPSKSKVRAATKRRSLAPSAPELKVSYKTAGRDTMAAIEEDLASTGALPAEAPLIEISETPAGRDTMAAIAEELAAAPRPKQNTLPYGDRISNAPGARRPSRAPAVPARLPAPVPVPVPAPAAGAASSHQAQEHPQAATPPQPSVPAKRAEGVEIFELLTFIVRGTPVHDLTTDPLRRRFVEQNLLHRVPGGNLDQVERIEVTPWTAKGTMVVRVWCRA